MGRSVEAVFLSFRSFPFSETVLFLPLELQSSPDDEVANNWEGRSCDAVDTLATRKAASCYDYALSLLILLYSLFHSPKVPMRFYPAAFPSLGEYLMVKVTRIQPEGV